MREMRIWTRPDDDDADHGRRKSGREQEERRHVPWPREGEVRTAVFREGPYRIGISPWSQPCRIANCTTCARLVMPSLAQARAFWLSTAFVVTAS